MKKKVTPKYNTGGLTGSGNVGTSAVSDLSKKPGSINATNIASTASTVVAPMAEKAIGGTTGKTVGGALSGAGSGASLGASIGSIIPGVGTAIGAGIGAVGGAIYGGIGGFQKGEAEASAKKAQAQAAEIEGMQNRFNQNDNSRNKK